MRSYLCGAAKLACISELGALLVSVAMQCQAVWNCNARFNCSTTSLRGSTPHVCPARAPPPPPPLPPNPHPHTKQTQDHLVSSQELQPCWQPLLQLCKYSAVDGSVATSWRPPLRCPCLKAQPSGCRALPSSCCRGFVPCAAFCWAFCFEYRINVGIFVPPS